jgi:hypothetical protein
MQDIIETKFYTICAGNLLGRIKQKQTQIDTRKKSNHAAAADDDDVIIIIIIIIIVNIS